MAEPTEFVAALARAYSLSEIFALEDAPVREALERAANVVDVGLTVRIEGSAIRIDGRSVDDDDGMVGELARDLELSDVCQLRIPRGVDREELQRFVSALRDGAGRGDGVRSADALARDLPRIGVAFAGAGARSAGATREVSELFEWDREPPVGRRGAGAGSEPRAGPDDGGREVEEAVTEAREPAGAPASGEVAEAPSSEAALESAVTRFLTAGREQSDDAERELRAAADRVRAGGALDELAEAVERLVLHDGTDGGDVGPSRARSLARELLDPPLTARFVLRLGATRDEERRRERIEAAARLGGELASALTDALIDADADERTARRAYIDALVALGRDARAQVEEMLDDDRWFVVRNGARILARIGDETDAGLLTAPLAHDDPRVRRETLLALGRIGGGDAEALVLGMLDDPEPEVRGAAAMGLGALRPERAVKPLLERLDAEDDEETQIQVVRALGAIGDPGAVPALEKRAVGTFFSRPSRPLRVAVYRALAGIGTPHAMELLEDARHDGDDAVRRVARSLLEE